MVWEGQTNDEGMNSLLPWIHKSDDALLIVLKVILLLERGLKDRPSCSRDSEEEIVWWAFTTFELPRKMVWAEWDKSSSIGENMWRDQQSK